MRLADLAARIDGAELVGSGDAKVTHVTADSRDVGPGSLFVAVAGLRVDGHEFAAQAVAAGAVAVVAERPIEGVSAPILKVKNSARALGQAAAALAGDPAKQMRLVGITGTNGKTTTSYLVEAIVAAAERTPGVIGTVSYRYGAKTTSAPYTTPTPTVLHDTFSEMLAHGVDDAILEVSSIALSMQRLAGVEFAVAAFTNLTQDHLDIHGSMDAYQDAKAILFAEQLAGDGCAVINVDAAGAEAMLDAAKSRGQRRIIRVSSAADAEAEVRVAAAESTIAGITATIETPRGVVEIKSASLLGHYNVSNIAVAVAIAEALDIDHGAIRRGIADMAVVPGRVERVANDRRLDILVDYAHTPDALANVLDALKPLCSRRLICVFGCGGDRDPGKRPLMGAAASERADLVIVTSDNPRTENPQAIVDMILPGVPDPFYVDIDRAVAIRAAVMEAAPGDVVLIAGKGHEDYQILGTETIHFDDREHAATAVAARRRHSLGELAEATGGTVIGDGGLEFDRVVIDGRATTRGDLYVAIRGERFDGHAFVDQARRAGAASILVERGTRLGPEVDRVVVFNTRQALGAFARHVRRGWGKNLIAITGSAGKTTTKDLIAAATRSRHPLATRGSLNNETGVPLTILGLRDYHRLAIVEMGMRGTGQIDELCEIAEPDIGVVTNAGLAHIGVIGSEADIVRGKSEVFGRLPPTGTAIYPADDPRLARFALAAPNRLSFGVDESADVRLVSYAARGAAGSTLRVAVRGREYDVTLALYGRHNGINATAALATAIAVGVPIEDAIAGLASARPPGMRGERIEIAGRHLLIDCYNSNPQAVSAALITTAELAEAAGAAALAVLGDMLELGDRAELAHRKAGVEAAKLGVGVVSIGEFGDATAQGAWGEGDSRARHAKTPEEAAEAVWERSNPGDWILFKASRGAKLERVVALVRELGGKAQV